MPLGEQSLASAYCGFAFFNNTPANLLKRLTTNLEKSSIHLSTKSILELRSQWTFVSPAVSSIQSPLQTLAALLSVRVPWFEVIGNNSFSKNASIQRLLVDATPPAFIPKLQKFPNSMSRTQLEQPRLSLSKSYRSYAQSMKPEGKSRGVSTSGLCRRFLLNRKPGYCIISSLFLFFFFLQIHRIYYNLVGLVKVCLRTKAMVELSVVSQPPLRQNSANLIESSNVNADDDVARLQVDVTYSTSITSSSAALSQPHVLEMK